MEHPLSAQGCHPGQDCHPGQNCHPSGSCHPGAGRDPRLRGLAQWAPVVIPAKIVIPVEVVIPAQAGIHVSAGWRLHTGATWHPTLVAAKSRAPRPQRFTGAVGAAPDCPAMLGPAAASRNSQRSLRSLRSNNRDESVDGSRCARGRKSCASRRTRGALQPGRTRKHGSRPAPG